mgnify:CR=1 FL=1
MFQTTVAALTDKGRKRRNNEDWTVHFEPSSMDVRTQNGCLYIVADGVGGAAKGEQASQYAAQKLLYDYYHHTDLPPAERLSYAMRQAGNEIYKYAEEQGAGRMATTMVAAVILANKLIVANVGDSRAYALIPAGGDEEGRLEQLTRDHSVAKRLEEIGQITREEADAFVGADEDVDFWVQIQGQFVQRFKGAHHYFFNDHRNSCDSKVLAMICHAKAKSRWFKHRCAAIWCP